ncbi:MAG: aconitase X, partial [Thermoplasmatota archaeon]
YEEGMIDERLHISIGELDGIKEDLYPAPRDEIDTFVLGCPQFGLAEFERLYRSIRGRRIRNGKRIVVYTSRSLLQLLDEHKIRELREAGVEIYRDTCMVVTPLRSIGIERVGTDSGKAAHYIPKMSRIEANLLPLDRIVDICME